MPQLLKNEYKMAKNSSKNDKLTRKIIEITIPGRGKSKKPVIEFMQFAKTLIENRQWPSAIPVLQQITDIVPGYKEAWIALFDACNKIENYVLLQACAEKCLAKKPRYVPALIALGTALRLMHKPEQAIMYYEKAVKLSPTDAGVLNHLGVAQKELGLNEDALETFNRCIAIKQDYTTAYWNRSDLLTNPSSEQIDQMEQILSKTNLSLKQQARLHYSFARALEIKKDYVNQFEHIRLGAEAKRKTFSYSVDQEVSELKSIPEFFSQSVLDQQVECPDPSSRPIFICGLPRSGTTLLEQILASHPEVEAGDEINALPTATVQILQRFKISQPYPKWVPDLSAEDWGMIGHNYMEQTHWLQTKRFFTDKNLNNYRAIGLIHLSLPHAKIIYCRRNPMDTLWGCYRQLFGEGMMFTYDQKELAQIWRASNSAVEYWKQTLKDKLFIFDYEDLIENQESVTRSVLDYVGLDWSDRCLHFYENKRVVKTISAVQVRSPLNHSRIDQWKRYEDHLDTMKSMVFQND